MMFVLTTVKVIKRLQNQHCRSVDTICTVEFCTAQSNFKMCFICKSKQTVNSPKIPRHTIFTLSFILFYILLFIFAAHAWEFSLLDSRSFPVLEEETVV